MAKFTTLCAAGALALALAIPARAEPDANTVVATVNGEAITLGQMIAVSDGLEGRFGEMPDQDLYDAILKQMISQLALAQQGEAAKTNRDEIALQLDRRAYLAGAVLERAAQAEVSDEDLRAAYEAEFAKAAPTTEYSAAHILVETEDEARAIKAEIDAGKDFGELAKEKSTGPSGPNAGDLGWFTLDMMVEPFSDAVGKMKAGEVSDPVQTQFGWHIIKLNETRNAEAPAFEEVKDQLADRLRADRMQARIDEVTNAAKVERSTETIDPAMLHESELLGQ